MRRHRLGDAPPLRLYGYPKDNGTRLTDWHGKTIARSCKVIGTKVHWLEAQPVHVRRPANRATSSSSRVWYGCRGMGDGMAASCRVMKKAPPRSSSPYWDKLDGAQRRRR